MKRSTPDLEAIAFDVAQQIRLLREQQNLSQRDLAELSGLSRNTVSLLERGHTSPTLATLQRIADALDVDIRAFFQKPVRAGLDLHVAEPGRLLAGPTNYLSDRQSCRIDRLISAHILHVEPGTSSGPLPSHPGEEYILCLRGRFLFCIDDHSYLLERGNSLIVDGRRPHYCHNPGQKTAEALVVMLDIAH